MISERQTASVL